MRKILDIEVFCLTGPPIFSSSNEEFHRNKRVSGLRVDQSLAQCPENDGQ